MDDEPIGTEARDPETPYAPKRRRGGKAKGPASPKGDTKSRASSGRRPVKLTLDEKAYGNLVAYSTRKGETFSDVVSELIRTHLGKYKIIGPDDEASAA